MDKSNVAILSKDALIEGATLYAQGGVSAALDKHDSIESHVQDTLITGVGLCNPEIVHFVVEISTMRNIVCSWELGSVAKIFQCCKHSQKQLKKRFNESEKCIFSKISFYFFSFGKNNRRNF